MSDMKCPFCQQELEDANIHSSGLYFECPNCYDKQKEKDDNYTATPKVWQELIRIRKALNVAVDALKEYADRDNWSIGFAPWAEDGTEDALYTEDGYKTANKALEQITELEQKD